MIVTDWIHELSVGMFTDHHHSSGDNKPPTLLINGVGRFRVFNNDTEKPLYMKAARFNVEQVLYHTFERYISILHIDLYWLSEITVLNAYLGYMVNTKLRLKN